MVTEGTAEVRAADDAEVESEHGRGTRMVTWTTQRWVVVSAAAALAVLVLLGGVGAWLLGEGNYVTVRDWVFGTFAAVALALIGLVLVSLRRGAPISLNRLTADAERVAGGDFDHAVGVKGSAEVRWLATQVELMRRRLVDELTGSEQARRILDEQAHELRRSNTELEQFAYVASHDLQEPLRKVTSFCELLQRRYAGQLDARADQYIAFAVDGATRMQALIGDLLAFSRFGRLHSEHAIVDMERVFANALAALSLTIEESGATVTHDPLPRLDGNETELGMLVRNLLSNALKFRDPKRTCHVYVEAAREGGDWRFAVADNGIGVDPSYADKVFTIFQRLHSRDAYPGNGIGLAICKRIVESHGGSIGLDLSYSPGARVTFTLPATEAVREPTEPATTA